MLRRNYFAHAILSKLNKINSKSNAKFLPARTLQKSTTTYHAKAIVIERMPENRYLFSKLCKTQKIKIEV